MIGDDKDIEEVEKAAEELDTTLDGKGYANEAIQLLIKDGDLEAKWYDFEEDFIPFARQFPRVLFIVTGDGEASDDRWELRVKGNDVECHEMVMPPFTNPYLLTDDEKNNNKN